MANYQNLIPAASFKAAVDLSTHQFKLVRTGSVQGEVALSTGASNPTVLGALQNSPCAAQEAEVAVLGIVKVICRVGTCDLRHGRLLFGASDGLAEPIAVTGSQAFGKYLGGTVTSGSVVAPVLLFGATFASPAAS